jgi:hypothetical protein
MATVTYIKNPGSKKSIRKEKTVKNLGWLLRHSKDVGSIYIHTLPGEPQGCEMTVALPGMIYHTTWASREVCRQWLRRPSFKGKFLSWFGNEELC